MSFSDWDDIRPPDGPVAAHTALVEPNSVMWRVHSVLPGREADSLNPKVPVEPAGGRFDCPSDNWPYAYSYFGDTPGVALMEVLGRSLRPTTRPRMVSRSKLAGKAMSRVRVAEPIRVALLHGSHLSKIGQTSRLTKSPSTMYPITRLWAAAVLEGTPDARGIRFRSRHDEDQYCHLLIGERESRLGSIEVIDSVDLESSAGIATARHELLRYNAVLL